DRERGHGNVGVLFHALKNHRATRKVAFFSNSSVRSGSELLSKLSFRVTESQGSRVGLLECSETGQCRICFARRRSTRPKLAGVFNLLHRGSFAVIKGVWISSFKINQRRNPVGVSRGYRTQLFSA